MNGRVEPRCRECNVVFDPDAVHEAFLAAFLDRVGFSHTGRRPAWCRHFCSEACRMADVRRRAADVNASIVRRRSARRAAARHEAGR